MSTFRAKLYNWKASPDLLTPPKLLLRQLVHTEHFSTLHFVRMIAALHTGRMPLCSPVWSVVL